VTLRVGTSGWAYAEWKPAFYPADLPAKRFLEHYGRVLTACEINATFYRRQPPATFAKWAASVPRSFRFAVKAHGAITYGKELAPDRARRIFDDFRKGVAALGASRGPILYQLHPERKRDDEQLARLLARAGAEPFAVELRDESWRAAEIEARVAEAGGTVCFTDEDARAPLSLPPGPIAYVRLRSERYTRKSREAWRELLEREARARDVYVFARHEGVKAGDPFTGVGLAQWLVEKTRVAGR
jgi:uncharacterized protein YecE (DUF72 family)